MKQVYTAPAFDVSVYDVDDIITLSFGSGPVDGGDDGWVEI